MKSLIPSNLSKNETFFIEKSINPSNDPTYIQAFHSTEPFNANINTNRMAKDEASFIIEPFTGLKIKPNPSLPSNIATFFIPTQSKLIQMSFLSQLPNQYDFPFPGYSIGLVQANLGLKEIPTSSSSLSFTLLRLLDKRQTNVFKTNPIIYALIFPNKKNNTSTPSPPSIKPLDLILIEQPLVLRSAKIESIPLALRCTWSQVHVLGQCDQFQPCSIPFCTQLVSTTSTMVSNSTNHSSHLTKCEDHFLMDLKKAKSHRMEFALTTSQFQYTQSTPTYSQTPSIASSWTPPTSLSILELEQTPGALVYWLGQHKLFLFQSSRTQRNLYPKRKALVQTTMQECHSIGAHYLRKIHHLDDSLLSKDPKQKDKKNQRKRELEKGIESIMQNRFILHQYKPTPTQSNPSPFDDKTDFKKRKFTSPSTSKEGVHYSNKDEFDLSDTDELEIIP